MALLVTSRCGLPFRSLAGVLLMFMLAGGSSAPAQEAVTRENQLKAVFLFNFAQFVEWPASAFDGTDSPLVIGVMDGDPIALLLDEVVRGELIQGRPLQVRRYRQVQEVADCHILFINRSESARLEEFTRRLQGGSILTVGDGDRFAERGIMIGFVTERDRIRLRINLGAARASGLQLSSKLLRSAEIVTGGAGLP